MAGISRKGSLVAAAFTSGASIDEMTQQALALRKRDLFRINHVGMVMERMHNPAIYLEHPLRELIDRAVPKGQFDDLRRRLLVNTVDIALGTQVIPIPVNVNTRYVMVQKTTSGGTNDYLHLAEVEVMGQPTAVTQY